MHLRRPAPTTSNKAPAIGVRPNLGPGGREVLWKSIPHVLESIGANYAGTPASTPPTSTAPSTDGLCSSAPPHAAPPCASNICAPLPLRVLHHITPSPPVCYDKPYPFEGRWVGNENAVESNFAFHSAHYTHKPLTDAIPHHPLPDS